MSKLSALFRVRVPAKEQTFFAKRLAFLVRAGVPIFESLNILSAQAKSRGIKRVLNQLTADVSNGQYLAVSLGRFRRTFGDFAVNIIRIGEESGTLDDNLAYLAQELKKRQDLKRKVRSALVYPTFIVVATVSVMALLTLFIFPRILPVFRSLNYELPAVTRWLIALSNFLRSQGLWVLAALVGLPIAIAALSRFPFVHYALDRTLLTLPVAGTLSRTYQLANCCRTLGLLLQGAIKIVNAVTITAETTTNLVYRRALLGMAAAVTRGESLATSFGSQPRIFPDMVAHMVAIGEKTGHLPETLGYLAELYEGELDELTKNLSGILEPALLIFMGLIVGFVAVAVITPIYGFTQSINP